MKLKFVLVFVLCLTVFELFSTDSYALFGGRRTRTTTTSTTTAGPSSSTATTNTSQSTTTTTTTRCRRGCSSTTSTAVTDRTTGTIPGDTSGMNFSCTKTVTDGMSSIQNSVMSVPNSFVESYVDQVFSVAGMSIGVGSLVSSVMGLLTTNVDDFCNRMVPLVVNPSGQETTSSSEADSIVGSNSPYVAELAGIATQMETLTASLNSGTVTQAEGQDILDQFVSLQNDQVDILNDMNDDMSSVASSDAAGAANAPTRAVATPSVPPPACDAQVTYASIASPTGAEIAQTLTHTACFNNSNGACCYDHCDATLPGTATAAVVDAYANCYQLSVGSGYCCFN